MKKVLSENIQNTERNQKESLESDKKDNCVKVLITSWHFPSRFLTLKQLSQVFWYLMSEYINDISTSLHKDDMLGIHKSEGSSPHDQMTLNLQRCCFFSASCRFVFSSETMEKLLKREKEVSTLTSQVEALKSQMAGKSLHDESGSRELSQPLPSFLSKSLVSERLNVQTDRSFSLQLVFHSSC